MARGTPAMVWTCRQEGASDLTSAKLLSRTSGTQLKWHKLRQVHDPWPGYQHWCAESCARPPKLSPRKVIFLFFYSVKIIHFRFSGPRTNPDEPGAPGGRNGRTTAKRCGRNERTTAQRFERTDEPPRSGEADEPQTAVRLLP